MATGPSSLTFAPAAWSGPTSCRSVAFKNQVAFTHGSFTLTLTLTLCHASLSIAYPFPLSFPVSHPTLARVQVPFPFPFPITVPHTVSVAPQIPCAF
jgi:hypothetical protein